MRPSLSSDQKSKRMPTSALADTCLLAEPAGPAGWDRVVDLGGSRFRIRPIRPMDSGLYPDFLRLVSEEDLRLRYFSTFRSFSAQQITKMTRLDFVSEAAFIAVDALTGDMAGVVRYAVDGDNQGAEFGILVRSDLHGIDLGRKLLLQLLYFARAKGGRRIYGFVRRDNPPMLTLAASRLQVATASRRPNACCCGEGPDRPFRSYDPR